MFASSRTCLRLTLVLTGAATLGVLIAKPLAYQANPYPWFGYGRGPQHTSLSKVRATGLGTVKWSVPVDMFPQSAGAAHYASPSITAANTVVIGVKTGESDGFKLEGRSGADGSLLWTQNTDYSLPPTSSTLWTAIYPMGTAQQAAIGAGGGGTVYVKSNADDATSPVQRMCFYQALSTYDASPATYAGIKISTPMTGNASQRFYFGYTVFGSIPTATQDKVGRGGLVRMTLEGKAVIRKTSELGIGAATDDIRIAYNSAPALSNDGLSVYVAATNATNGKSYLVKLDSQKLVVQGSVLLKDPKNNLPASICPCSSASPMVAPDGQVFFGVLRNSDRTSHGWMLQFAPDLAPHDASGHRWPVGAFGWDDTPSVVPAKAVKSYKGTSPYLLLTKYNNYKSTGGDGRNKLAILDPKMDDITRDPTSGIRTMNEIITVTGVTCDSDFYSCTASTNVSDPSVPVREWCINAAAVDPSTKSAIVNCEDGKVYRWDFTTNTLKEGTVLQPSTGEPYTSTAIGPDGTSYAINNGHLHAVTKMTP